jgi:hypothetical protein
MIVRIFSRLILLMLAWIVVRRSAQMVGTPARPGGRAQFLPWLGLVLGGMVILGLARSCVRI